MPHIRIVFLLLPNLHLLDLAGPDQVFYEGMAYGANLKVEYCSISTNVLSSNLLPFGKISHFSKLTISEGDFIVIPGADVSYLLSNELRAEEELMLWLQMAHRQKVNLCSICTGAFLLGQAGLLDNRKCTTHWQHTYRLQKNYPKACVQENILFTEDEGIYTSAGVTAGIDMALYILAQVTNEWLSYEVAKELVVYIRRQGNDNQRSLFLNYRNHIHYGIHRLQDWLQSNLDKKATLNDLSEIANMSSRNLTRVFRKETGVSIKDFVMIIRKQRISQLLNNPNMTRQQIAAECGLKSTRQLMRIIQTDK